MDERILFGPEHLNEYGSLRSQISAKGTTIKDELREMLLMSSLPSSWETFITTVCNASKTVVKYSEVTSAILTEVARRKSFAKDSEDEAYLVQGSTDRSNNRRRRSSRLPTNQRSWSSPGTTEPTIIARNRDTSKPIAAQSKPKPTKLNERIRRVAGMRRSITSTLQPKHCRAT